MTEFFKVVQAEEVFRIFERFSPVKTEQIHRDQACGRALSKHIVSPEDLPHFPRSTMDGFAVRSEDTYGASEGLPLMLNVVGRVVMGKPCTMMVKPGEAIAITTGGMLPEGADSVIMEEYCHVLDEETIEITKAVTPWENVLRPGEDVKKGDTLFSAGHEMRFQDVGLLAALGIDALEVFQKPTVAVISTGDEVVSPEVENVPSGKVRDVNGPSIYARLKHLGYPIEHIGIAPDNETELRSMCEKALFGEADSDVLLLSGGSSIGMRDFTLNVISKLPESQILFHGIAIKPGKPTIFATSGTKAIWGLPGHPVSSMIALLFFVEPFLRRLEGFKEDEKYRKTARAVLGVNIPSVHGRLDFVRVRLDRNESGRLIAVPVYGKSAMISTMTQASGLVTVPTHSEGLDKGTEVEVLLF